jgi:hypothetical protein
MCDDDELVDACAVAVCPIHQAAEFAHPPRVDLHVRVARDARGSPCHRCLMVALSRCTAPPRAEILKLKAAKSGGWLSEEEFDTEVKRLIREHNGEVLSLASILDARTCCYPPSVWVQMHGLAQFFARA